MPVLFVERGFSIYEYMTQDTKEFRIQAQVENLCS